MLSAKSLPALCLLAIIAIGPVSVGHPPATTLEAWAPQVPLTMGREGAAGSHVSGVFIMTHGYSVATIPPGDTSDAWIVTPGGIQVPLPPAVVPRSELVGATALVGPDPILDARYFAIGGRGPACILVVCDTVEIFNPITQTWAFGAPMPTPRSGLGAATIQNMIHVVGGAACGGPLCATPLATHEIYDPITNTWVPGLPLPVAVTDIYAVASIGCDLYVIGGWTGVADAAVVQNYDACAGAWAFMAPMPTARSNAVAGVCGGHIYVIGGTVGGANVAVVEEFEPAPGLGAWAPAPPLATPASEFAAGAAGWPGTAGLPGVIQAVGTGIFGAAGTQSSLMACA